MGAVDESRMSLLERLARATRESNIHDKRNLAQWLAVRRLYAHEALHAEREDQKEIAVAMFERCNENIKLLLSL